MDVPHRTLHQVLLSHTDSSPLLSSPLQSPAAQCARHLPLASLSARRSTAATPAACYPTSSRRSRRSWFPSRNAPRSWLRAEASKAEAEPVEERLTAVPAPSAPSEPLLNRALAHGTGRVTTFAISTPEHLALHWF